jgi:YidC/Oxa1 family membrane protein insertase
LTPVIGAGFLGIEHFSPPWDVFFLPLFNLLIFFYELPFLDLALAIIVFTIVIRTLLAPLFIRQIRSQKEMQRMQPLVREVQRKHKGNRQKIAEETMALYKEHGVNQFGGCLPVLLQLPLLLALYQALLRASGVITGFTVNEGNQTAFRALQDANVVTAVAGQANTYQVAFDGACNLPAYGQLPQFLPLNCQLIDPIHLSDHVNTTVSWLLNPFTAVHLNLAQIDHVFSIPIGTFAISALAIIAAVLQFVQVKMTSAPANPDDPTAGMTNTMMYTFPLLTIVWGGIFPSGLILYWIVYTGYLIFQQYLIMGWGNLFPLFGWQPSFVRRPDEAAALPRPREANPGPTKNGEAQPANNPRPQQGGGSRASSRSANRRSGAKRRGRKR